MEHPCRSCHGTGLCQSCSSDGVMREGNSCDVCRSQYDGDGRVGGYCPACHGHGEEADMGAAIDEGEKILVRRLANGEIDETHYQELLGALHRNRY
jgi:DnaJ-class molecular chaperone